VKTTDQNEIWARSIIARTDPQCRPRWEVFDEKITQQADSSHFCLNIGAGTNEEFDLAGQFTFAVDTDILRPASLAFRTVPFLQVDLMHLPFAQNSFDLVLLRFVAEHISDPQKALAEISRVLRPDGQVLILTTNLCSPFVFLPKFLLPYRFRKWLMKVIFRVRDDDVFPTYHRMNTRKSLSRVNSSLEIKELIYLQDINWTRRWLFLLLYAFHLKTKIFHLTGLRSNILARLVKITS
jgi:SAM-dependent methyltransferase